MILNHLKQGRAVTFMKYLASVVPLIFLPKAALFASNSMKLAELVVNLRKYLTIFISTSDLSLLNVKILRSYTS